MQYQSECKVLVSLFGKVECECIANVQSFNATQCCTDVQVCTTAQAAQLPSPVISKAKAAVATTKLVELKKPTKVNILAFILIYDVIFDRL